MFESGLDPRGQNKCQRKEEVGVWPWGADVRTAPRPFLEKLTVILKIGHQGAPTRRWICLPPSDTPIQACFSLSLHLFSLSGWRSLHLLSNSFCSLSSLRSLFFLFFFFFKRGKQSEK